MNATKLSLVSISNLSFHAQNWGEFKNREGLCGGGAYFSTVFLETHIQGGLCGGEAYFSTVFLEIQIHGGLMYGGGAGVTPDKEVTTAGTLTRVHKS